MISPSEDRINGYQRYNGYEARTANKEEIDFSTTEESIEMPKKWFSSRPRTKEVLERLSRSG